MSYSGHWDPFEAERRQAHEERERRRRADEREQRRRADELDALGYRLGTLAHNLAIGAALCRAWQIGGNLVDDWEASSRWSPGCGSAP